MAVNRVLTSDEKQTMLSNQHFIDNVNWAIRDFASFWTTSDLDLIGQQIGQVGYERWFKNRLFSVAVLSVQQPPSPFYQSINTSDAPISYLILSKGMNLWDSAVSPFNADTVISYMTTTGKFDELTANYVALKTESVAF